MYNESTVIYIVSSVLKCSAYIYIIPLTGCLSLNPTILDIICNNIILMTFQYNIEVRYDHKNYAYNRHRQNTKFE